jgi:hypothetical protein
MVSSASKRDTHMAFRHIAAIVKCHIACICKHDVTFSYSKITVDFAILYHIRRIPATGDTYLNDDRHFHQRPSRQLLGPADADEVQKKPITCHSPLRHSPWCLAGHGRFLHFCPLPSLSPASPASVLHCWLQEDATRPTRHVCHAPTLSAAQHAQQRRLGSGASAAVVLHFDGPEACPVAPCIHAERHGMRSSSAPRALSEIASLDPQSVLIPPVCLYKYSKYISFPLHVTTCSLSLYHSHSPAYLPQLAPTVTP